MKTAAVVVLQVLISFIVVAVAMPLVLVTLPATQDDKTGPGVAVGLAVLVFVVLRLGWPRRIR